MVQTYNSSTWDVEARASGVEGQFWLHREFKASLSYTIQYSQIITTLLLRGGRCWGISHANLPSWGQISRTHLRARHRSTCTCDPKGSYRGKGGKNCGYKEVHGSHSLATKHWTKDLVSNMVSLLWPPHEHWYKHDPPIYEYAHTKIIFKWMVLTFAALILKLEWYRDDWHGPYTRMTCIIMKSSTAFGWGKLTRPQPYRKNYRQKESWEQKKESSPERSTPIGYLIQNGQSWKHTTH